MWNGWLWTLNKSNGQNWQPRLFYISWLSQSCIIRNFERGFLNKKTFRGSRRRNQVQPIRRGSIFWILKKIIPYWSRNSIIQSLSYRDKTIFQSNSNSKQLNTLRWSGRNWWVQGINRKWKIRGQRNACLRQYILRRNL